MNYKYGKTLISSNLKYNFNKINPKYSKVRDKFNLELVVYCEDKKMGVATKNYSNVSINDAILDLFQKKVEQKYTFHSGINYYVMVKAFEKKPVTRYKYEKTDNLIFTERRNYLLQERINLYF